MRRCPPAGGDGVPRRCLRRPPPTFSAHPIDFDGRKGHIRTALDTAVPIAPGVAIDGQESRLCLSRSTGLAGALRLDKLAKIVMQVLEPVDIGVEVGADPDVDAVDAHARNQAGRTGSAGR